MFFLKNRHFKLFTKDIFFKDIIFVQHIEIASWCLPGTRSYIVISDSIPGKTLNILKLSQVTESLFQIKFY